MFALCFLTPRCEVEGMAARRTSSGDGASGSGGIGATALVRVGLAALVQVGLAMAAWGLALIGGLMGRARRKSQRMI